MEANEAELLAILGPRAAYYLGQWRGTATRNANWAAFFWSIFWLTYRRMYRVSMVFYGVILVSAVVEDPVLSWLGYAAMPRMLERAINIVPGLICGAMGNHWYRRHVQRVIADTRALGLPEDEHLKRLALRGGTRGWHAFAFFLAFFVVAALIGTVQALIEGDL